MSPLCIITINQNVLITFLLNIYFNAIKYKLNLFDQLVKLKFKSKL